SGRLLVTAGLGGMGGAQPLAATMNGAAALVVEVDPRRIERRLTTKYLDEATDSLDDAIARVSRWTRDGTARSIAVRANAADVLPRGRSIPMGSAVGGPRGHPRERRRRTGNVWTQRFARALDSARARARRVPGAARAHPVARVRRARALRIATERARPRTTHQGADRDRS